MHVMEAWRDATKHVRRSSEPVDCSGEGDLSGTLLRFPFLRRVPECERTPALVALAHGIQHIPPGRLDPGTVEYDVVINTISRMIDINLPSRLIVAFMTEFGMVPSNVSAPHRLNEMTDTEKDIALARYRMAMRRLLQAHAPPAQIESSMGFLEQSGVGRPGPDFDRVVTKMLASVSGENVLQSPTKKWTAIVGT